jgi:hypothetical protein
VEEIAALTVWNTSGDHVDCSSRFDVAFNFLFQRGLSKRAISGWRSMMMKYILCCQIGAG